MIELILTLIGFIVALVIACYTILIVLTLVMGVLSWLVGE